MHKPVLLQEVIQYLNPSIGGTFIDCTYGSGGHSNKIIEKIGPSGKLLGIDMDMENVERARINQASNLYITHANFKDLDSIGEEFGFGSVDGILFDLGLSSEQLDGQRGFGFKVDYPLDMRMDLNRSQTAHSLIYGLNVQELIRMFKELGEERYATVIARSICELRRKQKITTTKELTDIILRAVPSSAVRSRIHPATRIFQALRISVNDELNNLISALPKALNLLKKGGRVCIISFHSLEDRIVKHFFKQESLDCICSNMLPVCTCDHQAVLKILTKKPVTPTDAEVQDNPRSRSAKMRVAEKII
jgi:16S rRNA (cytosine1402-N4)-methyltransferase